MEPEVGVVKPSWATSVVMLAVAGDSPVPETLTRSVISRPAAAVLRTLSVMTSSSAWLAGSEPSEQKALCALGQSVKSGGCMILVSDATVADTRAAGSVLHTQIE